jgi:nucleotide-binding universal stress UspA family protein
MAMKVLIAVEGREDDAYFRRAAAVAPLERADGVLLVHVVDTGPRADLEAGRDRFLLHRSLAPERQAEIERAEDEGARGAMHRARRALIESGIPEERIHDVVLRGRPNEAIRDLADSEDVSLIVVRGHPGKPGPHSLGKTARFLVDHARHAALLVR